MLVSKANQEGRKCVGRPKGGGGGALAKNLEAWWWRYVFESVPGFIVHEFSVEGTQRLFIASSKGVKTCDTHTPGQRRRQHQQPAAAAQPPLQRTQATADSRGGGGGHNSSRLHTHSTPMQFRSYRTHRTRVESSGGLQRRSRRAGSSAAAGCCRREWTSWAGAEATGAGRASSCIVMRSKGTAVAPSGQGGRQSRQPGGPRSWHGWRLVRNRNDGLYVVANECCRLNKGIVNEPLAFSNAKAIE